MVQTNSDTNKLNIRYRYDTYVPVTNLIKYQKEAYYTRIKLFNNFPPTTKCLNHNIKVF
jgi:hypothetical protein